MGEDAWSKAEFEEEEEEDEESEDEEDEESSGEEGGECSADEEGQEFVAIDNADPPTLYPADKFEDAVRKAIDDKTLMVKVMTNSQSEFEQYVDNLTNTALRNLGLKLEGDTLVEIKE